VLVVPGLTLAANQGYLRVLVHPLGVGGLGCYGKHKQHSPEDIVRLLQRIDELLWNGQRLKALGV